jgi:D-3-phosphoglycerate dehydrogenase
MAHNERLTILISGPAPRWFLNALGELKLNIVHETSGSLLDDALFSQRIAKAHFYVCGGLERASYRIFKSARELRAIVFLGVDAGAYMDKPAALEHGIEVHETPGANSQATAEQTILHMLSALRGFPQLSRGLLERNWSDYTGDELTSRRVCLIGLGQIGSRVAWALRNGFNCHVSYHSRTRQPLFEDMLGITWEADLHASLRKADIVSLHLPLIKHNGGKYFLDDEEIGHMRRRSILINTSSPFLVNPHSLYKQLSSKCIAFASFDGFYKEGPEAFRVSESKLLELGPNHFFMTPHTAWHTRQSEQRTYRQALQILRRLIQKDEM